MVGDWRALALGAVLCAAGCSDPPPVEERTVAGFVRDADGAGIDGADITFRGDTGYDAAAETDGDGFYELRVQTDSPFGQVRAEAAGFQPAEASVFFDTEERRIDLVLRRAM